MVDIPPQQAKSACRGPRHPTPASQERLLGTPTSPELHVIAVIGGSIPKLTVIGNLRHLPGEFRIICL